MTDDLGCYTLCAMGIGKSHRFVAMSPFLFHSLMLQSIERLSFHALDRFIPKSDEDMFLTMQDRLSTKYYRLHEVSINGNPAVAGTKIDRKRE